MRLPWPVAGALAAGALVVGALISGCTAPGTRIEQTEIPPIDEALAGQRQAVDGLDRLWARAVARINGRDAEGRRLAEQAEGFLQVIPPDRLALRLGKVGEIGLILGSNDRLYWWIDLVDSDRKVAIVGRHELATPQKTAELGLPVHPLDLIQLLGITPLPDDTRIVGWDRGSSLLVEHGARWGSRRVWLDPVTWVTRRVELLDDTGTMLASAELENHQITRIDGDAVRTPRSAARVTLTAAGFDGVVKLDLHDPRNRRLREITFDFDGLLVANGVDDAGVIDLDAADP